MKLQLSRLPITQESADISTVWSKDQKTRSQHNHFSASGQLVSRPWPTASESSFPFLHCLPTKKKRRNRTLLAPFFVSQISHRCIHLANLICIRKLRFRQSKYWLLGYLTPPTRKKRWSLRKLKLTSNIQHMCSMHIMYMCLCHVDRACIYIFVLCET